MIPALLDKPYYVFQPRTLARRLLRETGLSRPAGSVERRLPWGLPLRYRLDEEIGASVERFGIYDLCVSELIWRLLDTGDTAVDVGANVGHMTSVMAARVGPAGKVVALEPHPAVFAELAANVQSWRDAAPVEAHAVAASGAAGRLRLATGDDFARNRGTATIGAGAAGIEVDVVTLDGLLGDARVGVLKIDVEGHELDVLQGARELLGAARARDVLVEEWGSYPTPVTRCLTDHGYTLFSVDQRFLGVTLGPPALRGGRRGHGAPSYLATLEPERALARARRPGWGVFGLGPF